MRYYLKGSLENVMVFSALANLASTNRIRCEKRHTFNTMVGFNALNTYPHSSRGSPTHTEKQTRAKEAVASHKPLRRLKKISSLYMHTVQ